MAPFPEEDVIGKMADFLNKVHPNTYLVYNLSEHKYDYSFFNNSVIFPLNLNSGFRSWNTLSQDYPRQTLILSS